MASSGGNFKSTMDAFKIGLTMFSDPKPLAPQVSVPLLTQAEMDALLFGLFPALAPTPSGDQLLDVGGLVEVPKTQSSAANVAGSR